MNSLNAIDTLASHFDFKTFKIWREAYRWPLSSSRKCSEERIRELEQSVRENILQKGIKSYNDVLFEILHWKTGKRDDRNFQQNGNDDIERVVEKVVSEIDAGINEPQRLIEYLCNLSGVGIPVASAFLRFLDPNKHRFGIIDKFVAMYFNEYRMTKFKLDGNNQVRLCQENFDEYKKFQDCLSHIVTRLGRQGITFNTIDAEVSNFSSVDVEMAIFAYTKEPPL